MREGGMYAWRNPWFRWSVVSLVMITVLSMLVGFLVLPSMHADFTAQGLWASICRAAGVPGNWGDGSGPKAGAQTTAVVLERSMARPGIEVAIGRGATLALNCTMCHGAQGQSVSDAPNLAGQYPEVVIKQLHDYKNGQRSSAIMEALARNLSDKDMDDLAAYYGYLPKARTAPTTYGESLPALVRVGDPMRNIAPCISCHGGVDQKLGAPWLEGMPKGYLVAQLNAFVAGTRRNDSQAQMRSMVRRITSNEIDEVSTFYARKASAAELR
ncbi:MAG: c-type cytochrome [Betaproteobacteria bacterium]